MVELDSEISPNTKLLLLTSLKSMIAESRRLRADFHKSIGATPESHADEEVDFGDHGDEAYEDDSEDDEYADHKSQMYSCAHQSVTFIAKAIEHAGEVMDAEIAMHRHAAIAEGEDHEEAHRELMEHLDRFHPYLKNFYGHVQGLLRRLGHADRKHNPDAEPLEERED